MGIVVFYCVLLLCVVFSLGHILWRCFERTTANVSVAIEEYCLYGLFLLMLFLSVWHLFFPISPALYWAMAFAGIVYTYWQRKIFAASLTLGRIGKGGGWSRWGAIVVHVVVVLWAASAAPMVDDSALYHAQAIQWHRESVIVLGLGNLHDRLAFNSHHFLLEAFIVIILGFLCIFLLFFR